MYYIYIYIYKELQRREGDTSTKDVKAGKMGVSDEVTICNDRRNCT